MAAAVVIGSLEDAFPLGKRQVTGEEHTAAFITLGQQREQHLHFLPGLLDIAQIIDDQHFVASQFLQNPRQAQIPFGDQQILHQQTARNKIDPPPLANQFLAQGRRKMGLATARISKKQSVLSAIQKGSLQQGIQLLLHFWRQAPPIKILQAFLQRQFRLPQHSLYAFVPALLTFQLRQAQQIPFITQRFLLGPLGLLLVALLDRRQP